jgi:hypothetical protein
MNLKEMQQYRTEPEPVWAAAQMSGGDGYDRMEIAGKARWYPVPSWGLNGWDLGQWPYVVVYHRDSVDATFDLAVNVEGDADCYRFPTAELREEATDWIAFSYWQRFDHEWVKDHSIDNIPAHLRGAFSWARLDAERAKEQQ